MRAGRRATLTPWEPEAADSPATSCSCTPPISPGADTTRASNSWTVLRCQRAAGGARNSDIARHPPSTFAIAGSSQYVGLAGQGQQARPTGTDPTAPVPAIASFVSIRTSAMAPPQIARRQAKHA